MKTVDFSETVAAYDLKVGRCKQIVEFMKVCEVRRSRSFLTLTQGHLHMKIKTYFSQKLLAIFNQILYVSFKNMEMKIYKYDAGHMTKMAAMSIYGKNPSKIFFSRTSGPISTKLGK